MEIGVTKAVQDKTKIKLVEITKNMPLVFCWDTHLVKLKGRNVLLIVNASNRYTIATKTHGRKSVGGNNRKGLMHTDIRLSYFIWIWNG